MQKELDKLLIFYSLHYDVAARPWIWLVKKLVFHGIFLILMFVSLKELGGSRKEEILWKCGTMDLF